MPNRRRGSRTKGPKGKVRSRSMYEHVQGTTVRVLTNHQLPTGCCHLRDGIPCTYRMSHIGMKIENAWVPEEQAKVPVVKLLGYCKSHRPKLVEVQLMPLNADLDKQLNGARNQKMRIKRMTNAAYTTVGTGSQTVHLMDRTVADRTAKKNKVVNANTACGKTLKQAVVGMPQPPTCVPCQEAVTIAK